MFPSTTLGKCRKASVRRLRTLILLIVMVYAGPLLAQGAGPTINFLTPVGLKTTTLGYLDADTNFRLGQVDFDELEITTKAASLNFFYRFALLDRLALLGFGLSRMDIRGQALASGPETDLRLSGSTQGFGDPALTFRLGLYGTPALKGQAWLDYRQGFQVSAQVNWILPYGDYNPERVLNPGFNRPALDLALPMVLPIDGAKRTTFLEFTPQVRVFGANNEPFGEASTLEQDPLYIGEVQISHHVRGRWWLALGAQYQNGGATMADGQPRGAPLNQWYGEVAIGAIINRYSSLSFSYGQIYGDAGEARGSAWRVKLGLIL